MRTAAAQAPPFQIRGTRDRLGEDDWGKERSCAKDTGLPFTARFLIRRL